MPSSWYERLYKVPIDCQGARIPLEAIQRTLVELKGAVEALERRPSKEP